jgi:hypothetical protein
MAGLVKQKSLNTLKIQGENDCAETTVVPDDKIHLIHVVTWAS